MKVTISTKMNKCPWLAGQILDSPCSECGERARGDCKGIGSDIVVSEKEITEDQFHEINRILERVN